MDRNEFERADTWKGRNGYTRKCKCNATVLPCACGYRRLRIYLDANRDDDDDGTMLLWADEACVNYGQLIMHDLCSQIMSTCPVCVLFVN